MIQQKTSKNLWLYFRTKQSIWIYCFSILSICYIDYDHNNNLNKKLLMLNVVKKGNVLVRFRASGGAKSSGSISIYGRLLELKDTSEINVFIASGNDYFVKSIPLPDSGDIYPVWYTSDKEMILARSEETKDGMREFLIKRSEKGRKNFVFFYWGLTIFLLIWLFIDFIRGKIREG